MGVPPVISADHGRDAHATIFEIEDEGREIADPSFFPF
jgi:hypothetical protein